MKIDSGNNGCLTMSDGFSLNDGEKTSQVFNRNIRLADVKYETILVDDILINNGFKKARYMMGMGAFGRVYRVESQNGHDPFVLKMKRQKPLEKSELSYFLVQDKGLPVVKAHFGLVRHKTDRHLEVVYSMDEFDLKSKNFELEAVALEYIDGKDFDKYLKEFDISGSPIPEEEMLFLAQEVSRGASLFNDNGLVHRDLKPNNLMYVQKEGKREITFIDFSTALSVDEVKNIENDGITGTDGYMSPEAYKINGNPEIKDDSWALAAILMMIPFGKTPNEIYDENAENKLGTFEQDTKGFAEWDDDTKREMILKEFKDGLSENKKKYVNVIIDLTKRDAEERITTTEAYQRLSAITGSSVENVSGHEYLDPSLKRIISNDSGIDISVHSDEADP